MISNYCILCGQTAELVRSHWRVAKGKSAEGKTQGDYERRHGSFEEARASWGASYDEYIDDVRNFLSEEDFAIRCDHMGSEHYKPGLLTCRRCARICPVVKRKDGRLKVINHNRYAFWASELPLAPELLLELEVKYIEREFRKAQKLAREAARRQEQLELFAA